jgi:hypothetical protein
LCFIQGHTFENDQWHLLWSWRKAVEAAYIQSAHKDLLAAHAEERELRGKWKAHLEAEKKKGEGEKEKGEV